MAGQPLGQRLADKPPMWGLLGLGSLIPEMLAQSMMGYAIVCPDMIGGAEINAMEDQSSVDREFFVRYAQLAALSPMMQFLFCPPASSTKRTTARSGMLLRHVNR